MDDRLGTQEQWQRRQASTPGPIIAELARKATGAAAVGSHRLFEGYSNEVHRVRCDDGQDVVVRILRFDDEDLAIKSADEAPRDRPGTRRRRPRPGDPAA